MLINLVSITKFSLFILILFIVVLPSGLFFGVNVKIISILFSVFFIFLNLINRKTIGDGRFFVAHLTLSILFLLCYYVFSIGNGNNIEYVKDELMLFFSFFSVLFVLLFSIYEKTVESINLMSCIWFSCFFYSFLKIIIVVFVFTGFFSLNAVSDFVVNSFGVKPMLMPIFGNVTRFQLANDYIIGFMLFFLITSKGNFFFLKKEMYAISIAVMTLSVLISFSRYLFLLQVLGVLLLFFDKKIKSKKMFFIVLLFVLFFICLIFYYWSEIYSVIEIRFFSHANAQSDSIRDLQKECLSSKFLDSGIWGYGMGGYEQNCPGPTNAPYSYEVQYYGYYFKFGFFGFTLLMSLYVFPFIYSLKSKVKTLWKEYFVAIIIWMYIGFYNPYLISAFSAVVVTLIILNRSIKASTL